MIKERQKSKYFIWLFIWSAWLLISVYFGKLNTYASEQSDFNKISVYVSSTYLSDEQIKSIDDNKKDEYLIADADLIDAENKLYYVDVTKYESSARYVRISGQVIGSETTVSVCNADDRENKRKDDYTIDYTHSYSKDDNDKVVMTSTSENNSTRNFVTNYANDLKCPMLSYGMTRYEITVEKSDGNKNVYTLLIKGDIPEYFKANEKCYFLNDVKLYGNNQEKNLLQENEISYENTFLTMTKKETPLSSNTNSIQVQAIHTSFTTPSNAAYVKGTWANFFSTASSSYLYNSYSVSINSGEWQQVVCGQKSPELILKKGLNIIQINSLPLLALNKRPSKIAKGYRKNASYIILLYSDTDGTYAETPSQNTELEDIDVYQAYPYNGTAVDYAVLDSTDEDGVTTIAVDSLNPNIFVVPRTKDAKCTVTIPNAIQDSATEGTRELYYGFYVKLDPELHKELCVVVTPENGDEEKAEEYKFAINWKITSYELDALLIKNADLDTAFDKETYEYWVVPSEGENPEITFTPQESTTVSVYIDGKKVSAEGNKYTIPTDAHQSKIVVESSDKRGKTTYRFIMKRQSVQSTDNMKPSAKTILGDIPEKYEAVNKSGTVTGAYWNTFGLVSLGDLVDMEGTYAYDVTKHTYSQATDYAAVILELIMLGENPYDYLGTNYVDLLLKEDTSERGSYGLFANNIWALWALDAAGYNYSGKTSLINSVAYQASDARGDVDMRGWALAALANHIDGSEILKKKSDFAVAYLYDRMNKDENLTKDEYEGIFEHITWMNHNINSHGCAVSGLVAMGIDLTDSEWKAGNYNPITVFERYKITDKNSETVFARYPGDSSGEYNKDAIIALGDAYTGSNVFSRYALTQDRYKKLLTEVSAYLATMKTDSDDYKQLKKAYDNMPQVNVANGVSASGKAYYSLQSLYQEISGDKVDAFMGTKAEREKVIAVTEKINLIGTDYYKNLDKITEAKKLYSALGDGNSTDQARLQHYVTNYDELKEAESNVSKVLAVTTAIDSLPSTAAIIYEQQIYSAWSLYYALPTKEQAYVSNYDKLKELYNSVTKWRAIIDRIAKLTEPDKITQVDTTLSTELNNLEVSYNALTAYEKKQITNADKLTKIRQRIAILSVVNPVIDKISAIGEITKDNYIDKTSLVADARSAYNALAAEYKTIVSNYSVLEDAEIKLAAMGAEEEIAELITYIDKLRVTVDSAGKRADGPLKLTEANNSTPTKEIWTDEWIDYVIDGRSMVDQIDESKRAKIVNLTDLVAAEAYISKLNKTQMQSMLQALPDASGVAAFGQSGTQLTDAQVVKIASAKAAYDEMSDKDKSELVKKTIQQTTASQNIAAEEKVITADEDTIVDADGEDVSQISAVQYTTVKAAVENLEKLVPITQTYSGYSTAYLQLHVDKVSRYYKTYKTAALTSTSLAAVKDVVVKYNNLYQPYQTELAAITVKINNVTIAYTDMMALLEKKVTQLEQDISDASAIDEWILSLPTEITDDNYNSACEEIKGVRKAYTALNKQAQSYVSQLVLLETVEEIVKNYQDVMEAAGKEEFQKQIPVVTVKTTSYNSVQITWQEVTDTDSYLVYRKNSGGKWEKLSTVESLDYTDKTVQTGVTYYYTVKAASGQWGSTVYSNYNTDGTKAVLSLAKTKLKTVVCSGSKAVKLTWNKVSGANGYTISRAASKNGSYKTIAVVSKGSTVTYTDKKSLTTGKKYYYKIRSYRKVNGKDVFGAYSGVKSVKIIPGTSKISKASAGVRSASLKWSKTGGVTGYRIYRSTSKNGSYKVVATLKNVTSWKDSGLKTGKTYYYKVKAYCKAGGKNIYGISSTAKAVKVK